MALNKKIELENGIVVNYHRIVSINKITNNQIIVEIASYTSEEQRLKEIEALKNSSEIDVFIQTTYINTEYDADKNIVDFYNYLVTLEEFKEADEV